MIRTCPNCGKDVEAKTVRSTVRCSYCRHVLKGTRRARRGAAVPEVCACCGVRATKTVAVSVRLCDMCYEFSGPYLNDPIAMEKYIESGGAACWVLAGKRALFDKAPIGTPGLLRERDIPKLDEMRRRPGASIQGGVPFGFIQQGGKMVKHAEQQLTLQVIHTMLHRGSGYVATARELTRLGRPNKHGSTKWSASSVRFLAIREGWGS